MREELHKLMGVIESKDHAIETLENQLRTSKDQIKYKYVQVALTVKFLNFGTPEIFDVIYLKFNLKGILSKGCNWNREQ